MMIINSTLFTVLVHEFYVFVLALLSPMNRTVNFYVVIHGVVYVNFMVIYSSSG